MHLEEKHAKKGIETTVEDKIELDDAQKQWYQIGREIQQIEEQQKTHQQELDLLRYS